MGTCWGRVRLRPRCSSLASCCSSKSHNAGLAFLDCDGGVRVLRSTTLVCQEINACRVYIFSSVHDRLLRKAKGDLARKSPMCLCLWCGLEGGPLALGNSRVPSDSRLRVS